MSGSESESESESEGSQRPRRPPPPPNNATFELVCKASLEIACDRCSMVTMCSDAAIKGITAVLQKNLGLMGSAYVKIDGKDIHKQGSQYSCVDCERDDIDCDADAGEEKTALRRRRLLTAAAGTQEALLGEEQMSGAGEGGLVVGYAVRGLGSKQKRSNTVRVLCVVWLCAVCCNLCVVVKGGGGGRGEGWSGGYGGDWRKGVGVCMCVVWIEWIGDWGGTISTW